MTITITQNSKPKEIIDAIENIPVKVNKVFNAYKYLGKLKRGINGLAYQKEQRNEWD